MAVEIVDAGPGRISRSVVVNAPATELFALAADPRRHHELDGSGTVRDNVKAPERMGLGAKFTTNMKMYGVPYRITSRVTDFVPDEVVEWRHPEGHRWRWAFERVSADSTRVIETFDYHDAGWLRRTFYELSGSLKANARGIEASLERLRQRYAG